MFFCNSYASNLDGMRICIIFYMDIYGIGRLYLMVKMMMHNRIILYNKLLKCRKYQLAFEN